MTFDIHIGVRDTTSIKQELHKHFLLEQVYVDGDDWHVWGEPSDGAFHVVARMDTLGQAIDIAMRIGDIYSPIHDVLVPMSPDSTYYYAGVLVSVTQSIDWAEEYLDVWAGRVETKSNRVENYAVPATH